MSQKLVITSGKVVAVHTTEQDLSGKYGGCEIVTWDGPAVGIADEGPPDDPRTAEQRAADAQAAARAVILARHAQEAEQGVTLSNGWRMRYTCIDVALYGLAALLTTGLVTIVDADGMSHEQNPSQTRGILEEFAELVSAEHARQVAELEV